MSAGPTGLTRATVLWTATAAVAVHAVLRRFEPEGALATAAVLGFLLGVLPLLPGTLGRAWPRAIVEPLIAGLALGGIAVAAVLALDPLVAAGGATPVHAGLFLVFAILALMASGALRRISTLVGVEWLKLRKSRLLHVCLGVAALATLLAGIGHTPVENESGWTQAAHCLGVGFWTAEILVLVLGATAVAGEVSQGTMKMILPHAYQRAEWIAAKALVLLFACALFAVVVCFVGVGYTALDMGLGDVTRMAAGGFGEEDTLQVFKAADVMRGYLASMAAASAASLVASAMLGLLLSCVFHTLVPALSASFLVFAALKAGKMFLGLSPENLQNVYAHYPETLRRLTEDFGRAFSERWDETLLPGGLYLSLLTGTLAVLVAMRIFGRRDLHG